MATVQHTSLVDDLDGGPAQETVTFGVDGARYEIDLSHAYADQLRERLDRFVQAARRVPTAAAPAGRGRRRGQAAGPSPQDIRVWAAEQGIALSSRGRIPAGIVEQYREAHRRAARRELSRSGGISR